jgi:hypothetical protein
MMVRLGFVNTLLGPEGTTTRVSVVLMFLLGQVHLSRKPASDANERRVV